MKLRTRENFYSALEPCIFFVYVHFKVYFTSQSFLLNYEWGFLGELVILRTTQAISISPFFVHSSPELLM